MIWGFIGQAGWPGVFRWWWRIGLVTTETTEQTQMNVQQSTVSPLVEKVFTPSFDGLYLVPVEEDGSHFEPSLRRPDPKRLADELARLEPGLAMDGVTFRHQRLDVVR